MVAAGSAVEGGKSGPQLRTSYGSAREENPRVSGFVSVSKCGGIFGCSGARVKTRKIIKVVSIFYQKFVVTFRFVTQLLHVAESTTVLAKELRQKSDDDEEIYVCSSDGTPIIPYDPVKSKPHDGVRKHVNFVRMTEVSRKCQETILDSKYLLFL